MPPERTSRPRQDPVSCDSCRKKKLKCDRTEPCSNCRSRSTVCVFQGRGPKTNAADANGVNIVTSAKDSPDLRAENAAIRTRLMRLEEVVFQNRNDGEQVADEPLRHIGNTSTKPEHFPPTPESDVVRTFSGDLQFLEGTGVRENTRMPNMSYSLHVGIENLFDLQANVASGSLSYGQLVLPTQSEALQLFDKYIEYVDMLQHIIHTPSTKVTISEIYEGLARGSPANINRLVLLFAILSSTAIYWRFSSCQPQTTFNPADEAIALGMYWLRCALDAHTHSQRTASPTLEIIQGTILVMFLLFHMEGFSVKAFSLHSAALTNARHMGLHMTDATPSSSSSQTQIIETEMRRRVWWHLAATDWSMSLAPGPQEGTYFVQPRHVRVNKPRNVSDEDLMTKGADFSRPLSEPTIMSYYLSRIRLGEICREVSDATWEYFAQKNMSEMPYDEVLALDTKFSELLSTMPGSLEIKTTNDGDRSGFGSESRVVQSQRYFSNLTIFTRRCKLHLPFLVRASQDPRFAFSRRVCLEMARKVLGLQSSFSGDSQTQRFDPLKLIGVLHHIFCAMIVLVMDLCVNRSDDEEELKEEIRAACNMLSTAERQCLHAGMYLESLKTVLRKYKVKLQGSDMTLEQGDTILPSRFRGAPASEHNGVDSNEDTATGAFLSEPYPDLFDGYLDLGATADAQDWDALFHDIDVRAYR